MMVLTFVDVIGRYFFNAPIIGSVEIISLMMGLVVFLGLGLATFEDGHIRVDIVTQLLPRKARLLMDVFAHLLSLGIAGLMSWRLTMVALDQTAEMNETQVLALPIWAVALVMAACSTLLVIGLGWHLSRAVRAFKG
jgi:TRAP-type C4-dicarboxylate transport system permease small subunit